MKLSTINTGYFKLDGGAMFGVVPKRLWQNVNPPDEQNMCTWAMRALLIEVGQKKILVDTGIGMKQNAKFRSHFEPSQQELLETNLVENGVHFEEITDVFLTHLHFDHVGGALSLDKNEKIVPTFPNATYWTNERHLYWALNPNPREKASFLKENIVPLQKQNKLKFIDVTDNVLWQEHIAVEFVYGHTEAMMLLKILTPNGTLVYCADLIPSAGHIGLPYVMSYDLRPLETMEEKSKLLEEAVQNNYTLFFEHDKSIECATVIKNEKGRIQIDKTMSLEDAFQSR